MTVYVDDARLAYGRMIMCHMAADSTAELLAMADLIGVSRKWLQRAGTPYEHFDVCLEKRALALQHGAIEVTTRDLVRRSLPGGPGQPATSKEPRSLARAAACAAGAPEERRRAHKDVP